MLKLKRVTSIDSDFQDLVHQLDQDLARRNGNQNSFYAQFNKTDAIKNALVCFVEDIAVGCGAFKLFEVNTVEIKRMFVHPAYRSKGIGAAVLSELEIWAAELNYTHSVLETGKTNPEAIKLYQKQGYILIPNFGPYAGVQNSVCMKKILLPAQSNPTRS
jgi:putative acetyltransferase